MKRFLLVPVFLIAVIFGSCKNQNSANLTRMSIKMTDAPGAYDALYLNVKEVQVITSDGQSTMEVNSKPFDILKFRLGKDTLLASKDIPSGTIEQIRLVLNDTGNTVVVDGKSFDLTTPSGQTSGIKLNVHDELISGVAYTMTLDFDAAKSIVKTGNGKYILKPVIRAIASAVSGALTGVVTPAASNAKVYAILGVDTVGAVADLTGKFFFPGLSEGTYKVNFVPDSPYVAKSVTDVVVTKGSVKDMGTITIVK